MSTVYLNVDPLQSNLDNSGQVMFDLLSAVSDAKSKQKNTNIALTIGDTSNQFYSGSANTNGAYFPPSAGSIKGFVFAPKVTDLKIGKPRASFLCQVGVNWQPTGFYGGQAPTGNPSVPVWFGFGELNGNTFFDNTTGTIPYFRQWFQVRVGSLLVDSATGNIKFTPFFGSYDLLSTLPFRAQNASGQPAFAQDSTDQQISISQLEQLFTAGQMLAFGVSVDTGALTGAQESALVTMLSFGFEWIISLNLIYNSILSINSNIS